VISCSAVGLVPLAATEATQTWTRWNPDETPAPDGCFSMHSLADDLVAADQLAPVDRERFVSTIEHAARRDQFSMTLTMYGIAAARPTTVAPNALTGPKSPPATVDSVRAGELCNTPCVGWAT
jgi:hypothetical protein